MTDSILHFRDSFREPGRNWALGYGFSEYNEPHANRQIYHHITQNSSYLHLHSNVRRNQPVRHPLLRRICSC
jgi:hypothetical protein